MKKFLVLILSFFVGACAAPERTVTSTVSWPMEGRMATASQSDTEVGWQLLYGERNAAMSTPISHLVVTGDNRAAGTLLGALGGGAIGLAAGQPAMGAVVGTVAGGISDALSKEGTLATTGTLVNPFVK